MKSKLFPALLVVAGCLALNTPAYATQINPPTIDSSTLPGSPNSGGYNSPGAQTNTLPGSSTAITPGNSTTPGRGNTTTPNTGADNGTSPFSGSTNSTTPNTGTTNSTLPGTGNSTGSGSALPGTLPGDGASTLPGTPNSGTANTLPGNAPGSSGMTTPGTLPGNGLNQPNGGTNLPGTSTSTPQVGGVTNDLDSTATEQVVTPEENTQEQDQAPVLDPRTGRTRPLLKAEPIPGEIDVYHVHHTDTLWIIAQKYMIDLAAIIDANPELPDPDVIYPGDEIKVPLDPSADDEMDIAASSIDKGDGSVKIRSNIQVGRYASTEQVQPPSSAEEQEILTLVNNERAKAGLKPLVMNPQVNAAARIKADEMCAKKYFNHTSPVYGTPFEMLRAFGVNYKTAGENIAKGQKSAKAVMGAWMNSQGHKFNILNPDFTDLGVGYATDGKTTYWVQILISK